MDCVIPLQGLSSCDNCWLLSIVSPFVWLLFSILILKYVQIYNVLWGLKGQYIKWSYTDALKPVNLLRLRPHGIGIISTCFAVQRYLFRNIYQMTSNIIDDILATSQTHNFYSNNIVCFNNEVTGISWYEINNIHISHRALCTQRTHPVALKWSQMTNKNPMTPNSL